MTALPPADQRETPTCQTCKARLCVHDGSAMCITARCPHYREVIVLADATRGAETPTDVCDRCYEAHPRRDTQCHEHRIAPATPSTGADTLREGDTALLDRLEARGVVSIYFADGSQLNPGSMSLRAALRTP